jgi:chitinase
MNKHFTSPFALLAPAVLATALGCSSQPGDGASDSQVAHLDSAACSGAKGWTENVAYATGAVTEHQGKIYKCIQGHTSLSVWSPDVVPALWQVTDCAPSADPKPTPTPKPEPTPNPGNPSPGNPTPTPPSAGGTEYAPYFYTWGWGNPAYPFTGLTDLKSKTGLSGITLAFVLADGRCAATTDVQQHKDDVAAFRSSGGQVKASFGGANGTYLENACGDAASLAGAIGSFVDETGITDLDFDVEQGGAMTADINAKRAQALKMVQASRKVKVALTLAAMPRDKWNTPGGITAAGVDVVRALVQAGVQISHVNLMTMDYGGYYSTGKAMGDLAISCADEASAQLRSIVPGLTEAQSYAMIGVTPMIGQNDVASEIFTIDDARKVAAYARDKKLGLVSFWAINRDQTCATDNLGLCSKVNKSSFEFHNVFKTAR